MRDFYPQSKASRLKNQIQQFRQLPSESLYEAWKSAYWYSERSTQKLGVGIYEIYQASALAAKLDSVVHMVQKLAQNQTQPPAVTTPPATTHAPVPIFAPPPVLPYHAYASSTCCEICGGGHDSVDCYILEAGSQGTHGAMVEHVDHVDYGRSSGPYQRSSPHQGNTHPGFSWSNPSRTANPTGVARGPTPGFQGQQGYKGNYQGTQQQWRPNQGYHGQSSYQGHQGGPSQFGYYRNQSHPPRATVEAPKGRSLEDLFQAIQNLNAKVNQVAAHNKMLESQIANQASPSSNKAIDKLPAYSKNPREQVNAITTRSGKQLQDPPLVVENRLDEVLKDKEPNEDKLVENQDFEGSGSQKGGDDKNKEVEKYIPPLSFPRRLRKVNMDERKMKFFNLIKQLNISIPLLDALTQILSYAKFLKDVLSNKRKFE
ncbi:uncharacterized protein LOC116020354 [Ipomoea triloba]|uniref:uncharacterized protein LOC116020354 n=1 Tax=Ipomoea triloba TaxID=35885 RepID=UPI00125E127D|nr:uncharacterized protein LOC116020354 [Ipomoea triloba]